MVEPLAKRVADLGWHVQFNVDGEMIDEMASMLRRLPTPMVFDHLAHPPLPAGIDHSSHKIVRELIDKGRTWVKVSGAYSNSKIGPPSYPEATKIAQAFVKAAPERLVWGSDWPHPGLPDNNKPNDALLFDLLIEWAPTRRRATASWCRIPRRSTASASQRSAGGPKARSRASSTRYGDIRVLPPLVAALR
jgi:D-galactarolactone isomerase